MAQETFSQMDMTSSEASEKARDGFITALRNTHALENQALSLMQRQIDRIENYPEVKSALQRHYSETEGQIERLETMLEQFDSSSSTLKDVGGQFMGNMAAIGHAMTQDEILKNSAANYAFENFEVASYKSLLHMADILSIPGVKSPLEQSLSEEMAMVQWIDDNMRDVIAKYITRYSRGETAGI